jgi:hypothetical protein
MIVTQVAHGFEFYLGTFAHDWMMQSTESTMSGSRRFSECPTLSVGKGRGFDFSSVPWPTNSLKRKNRPTAPSKTARERPPGNLKLSQSVCHPPPQKMARLFLQL